MIEQISGSIDFDCDTKYDLEHLPKQTDGMTWHSDEMTKAIRDLNYHTDEQQKELDRTEGRNRWLADLRRSLPPQAA